MKVISAGMPRTGSQSLGRALEILGYRTYTMGICVQFYSHLNAWYRHVEGHKKINFSKFFHGYEATVGIPACFYYQKMMQVFPESKIILCPRKAENWYRSFDRLRAKQFFIREKLWFLPRIHYLARTIEALIFNCFFKGNVDFSRDYCIAQYQRYNEEVISKVPKDNLLIFTVDQGWEPLCTFLDKPVPNVPFPHVNKSDTEVIKNVGIALFRDFFYLTAIVVICFILWRFINS